MLIHQPTGGYQGQSSDIEIHARETLALRACLDELYARHTGKSADQIHADSDRDRYMTPKEAVEYGLVDRIVSGRR
jgi:ATP-dependent Clp protease protease subunit